MVTSQIDTVVAVIVVVVVSILVAAAAVVYCAKQLSLRRRRNDLRWLRENLANLVTDEFIDYLAGSLDAEKLGPVERVLRLVGSQRGVTPLFELEVRVRALERRIDNEMVTEQRVVVITVGVWAGLCSIFGLMIAVYQVMAG